MGIGWYQGMSRVPPDHPEGGEKGGMNSVCLWKTLNSEPRTLNLEQPGKATTKPKEACGATLKRGRMGGMPDPMETPSDVILTPHGLLLVENAPPPSPWQEAGGQ